MSRTSTISPLSPTVFRDLSTVNDPKELTTQFHIIIKQIIEIKNPTEEMSKLKDLFAQLTSIRDQLKAYYSSQSDSPAKRLVENEMDKNFPTVNPDENKGFLAQMCYLAGVGDALDAVLINLYFSFTQDQIKTMIDTYNLGYSLASLRNNTEKDSNDDSGFYHPVVDQMMECCARLSLSDPRYREIEDKLHELDVKNQKHLNNVDICNAINSIFYAIFFDCPQN